MQKTKRLLCFQVVCALALLGACANQPSTFERVSASDIDYASVSPDKLRIVDCLTPGQVRRLGAHSQTITPRRVLKTSAAECEVFGGEYVATSAQPRDALKVWLPYAQQGDAQAQLEVGELYERGLDGTPDYTQAKQWYERAAAQNNRSAAVNLAALLEKGLGGNADVPRAKTLIAQSSGVSSATPSVATAEPPRIDLIEPVSTIALLPKRSAAASPSVAAKPGPITLAGRVTAEAGVDKVLFNGELRPVDANGLFNATLNLQPQPTRVNLQATDKRGASTELSFSLSPSAPAPVKPISADSGNGERIALVIANQNYRHYEKLSTPYEDAKGVRDVLQQRYGFKVTYLQDATRKDILVALNQLRLRVGANDQVLIYYAGHGELDKITQRGYWVPVDGDKRNTANWVSAVDVSDQVSAMPARHVMVIADSCYSGIMSRSTVATLDKELSQDARNNALAQLGRTRARLVLTSGGVEPVVDGGGGLRSIFARSLIEVLSNLDGPIEAQQLHSVVTARFLYLSRRLALPQRPEYGPLRFAGHEAGDFVLRPL
jgi:uncharacterized protein